MTPASATSPHQSPASIRPRCGARAIRWAVLAWLLPLLASAQTPPQEAPPEPEPAPAAAVEQPAPPPPAQVGVRGAEIAAWLPPEQLLWLEAEGDRFPARFRAELTGRPRGAVVILHDAGQHPSWPATLAALFDELPRHGWHALAVALPPPATLSSSVGSSPAGEEAADAEPDAEEVAKDEAAAADPVTATPNTAAEPAPPTGADPIAADPATPGTAPLPPPDPEQQSQARVAAAIAHLAAEQEAATVVLAGFGNGALRAVRFAADPALRDRTAALVLVDFPVQEPAAAAATARLLAEVAVPTLDVRQGEDAVAARQAQARREATLKQRDRLHTQLQLPALAAPAPDAATPLVRRLRGWLQRHLGE